MPERWHGERICGDGRLLQRRPAGADEALAPIRALGDPIVDLLDEQPYTEVQSYLDDTEPKGNHYYWKTEYLAELSDELLTTVRELSAECPIPGAELGFLHLGGALNDHPETTARRQPRRPLRDRRERQVGARRAGGRRRSRRVDPRRRGSGSPVLDGRQLHQLPDRRRGRLRIRETYGANYDRLLEPQAHVRPGEPVPLEPNLRP